MLVSIAVYQLFFVSSPVLAQDNSVSTEIRRSISKVDTLIMTGKFDEAISLAKDALENAKATFGESDTTVANVLHQLGKCYYFKADYPACESYNSRAMSIREKILGPDHLEVAKSLNNLATAYSDQGKYSEAESLHLRALAIREKNLDPGHLDIAQSLNNLALLSWRQGKFAKAEPLYEQALDMVEKALGDEHLNLVHGLNNLAILYKDKGRFPEAEVLCRRAVAILEKAIGSNHPYVASTLINLANISKGLGKLNEAESLYVKAQAIYTNTLGKDHPDIALSLDNLAVLYAGQTKYVEAEHHHKEAIAIREKALGSEHPLVATSLDNLAALYYGQGRYAEAESLYVRALAIREDALGPNHPDVADCLRGLAVLYGSVGQFDKSAKNFKKLLKSRHHFIEHVFAYASEDQKMKYLEEYPIVNHSLLSAAVIVGSDELWESALEMILKAKATVIDAISAERQIAFCSYDSEIQKKAEKHAELCGEISTVTLAGVEKLEPEIYRSRLEALYREKDSLEAELSRSCSGFQDQMASKGFSFKDVTDVIPEGALLWEFVRYEPYDFEKIGRDVEKSEPSRYLAFTLDRTGASTLNDLGNAEEIDSLIGAARARIDRARIEFFSSRAADSEKRLRETTGELYRKIFEPLESSLGLRTNIFISPDGQLNLLPFEILPCADGGYVVEKYGISYLSSGRDLLRFEKKHDLGNSALTFADPDFDLAILAERETAGSNPTSSDYIKMDFKPTRGVADCLNRHFDALPNSRMEVDSISKTLEDHTAFQVGSFHGQNAREEILKEMATPPRILHLATHGYFCEDINLAENRMLENPLLRSGLAFAGANHLMDASEESDQSGDDGILTAFEASGLNLMGTDLVALSACESGVGQVRNGEGVFGLRRAFQHAGARTIVMSLWKVPDQETCDLMNGFYKNWMTGLSKKEALRQSVLALLNECRANYRTAHPFLWGGFVMVGDPD
jgi:CHAT domain-containing protein/Tfp pilus assembly protein PilF